MRTIKFRAWANGRKQMYYADFAVNADGTTKTWGIYDKLTLMQYTGLDDKQGREVYEGDIVEFTDMIIPNYRAVVCWGKCFAHSPGDDYTEMTGWVLDSLQFGIEPLYPFSNLRVIGNVYENPELLEG